MKRTFNRITSLGLGLVVAGAFGACVTEESDSTVNTIANKPSTVSGSWIVVLQDGVPAHARAHGLANAHGAQVGHVYQRALNGFSFNGSQQAAEAIAEHRDVAYIEPDGMVYAVAPKWCADDPDHPACKDDGDDDGGDTGGGQTTPWGITRVGGAVDGTGAGTAWVIDSGIDLDHPDLNVDTSNSANFVSKGKDTADDGNGHGTHVAGTIAAVDNDTGVVGVSAGTPVVAVRVLDNRGSGSLSDVIAGIDYVADNASAGDVANMSLGASGHHQSLHDAVVNAASTVPFSIAAGNDSDDASNYEPAHVEHTNVYTVSAIDDTDCLAYFSNFGDPIDYAAPGVDIHSTWKDGGYNTIDGTSMAAPHVAGLLLHGIGSDGNLGCGDTDGQAEPIAHH